MPFRARRYFNSIKVRLERKFYIKDAWVKAFQFHKGAIRTNNFGLGISDIYEFQFHKGAIRTACGQPLPFLNIGISIP